MYYDMKERLRRFTKNYRQGMIPKVDLEIGTPNDYIGLGTLTRDNMLSFNYNKLPGGVSNQVEITFYTEDIMMEDYMDVENGDKTIEDYIVDHMLEEDSIRFRYGYIEPEGYPPEDAPYLMSPWHSGLIMSYDMNFRGEGIEFTIRCISNTNIEDDENLIALYRLSGVKSPMELLQMGDQPFGTNPSPGDPGAGVPPTQDYIKNGDYLLGEPAVSPSDMKDYLQNGVAQDKGGATSFLVDAVDMYYSLTQEQKDTHGYEDRIRPDVMIIQSGHETAWGHFGGVIDASFNNYAGIKVANPPPGSDNIAGAHQVFDSMEEGVRAHLNHFSIYVNYEPLGDVHPRYHTTKSIIDNDEGFDKARTIADLARWATDENYPVRLQNHLNNMYDYVGIEIESQEVTIQENFEFTTPGLGLFGNIYDVITPNNPFSPGGLALFNIARSMLRRAPPEEAVKWCQTEFRPSDVVKEIAKIKGWKIGRIEETIPVIMEDPPHSWYMNPMVFINEYLTDISIASEALTNRGDYRVYLTDEIDDDGDPTPTVNFHPANYEEDAEQAHFYWWRGKPYMEHGDERFHNLLLNFSPDFEGLLMKDSEITGGSVDNVGYTDETSGEVNLEELAEGADGIPPADNPSTRSDKRDTHFCETSKGDWEANIEAEVSKDAGVYTASMEIVGFPYVQLLHPIRVTVLDRYGNPHHTSGLYTVFEVQESIDMSGYTVSISRANKFSSWLHDARIQDIKERIEHMRDWEPGQEPFGERRGRIGVGDIAGAEFYEDIIPINNQNITGRTLDSLSNIVIHNTAGPYEGNTADNHANAMAIPAEWIGRTAWHFTVDDLHIIQHVPIDERVIHAHNCNATSVGIEICMNKHGMEYYNGIEYVAYKFVGYLLAFLKDEMGKEPNVIRHMDHGPTACPVVLTMGTGDPSVYDNLSFSEKGGPMTWHYAGDTFEYVTRGWDRFKAACYEERDRLRHKLREYDRNLIITTRSEV